MLPMIFVCYCEYGLHLGTHASNVRAGGMRTLEACVWSLDI